MAAIRPEMSYCFASKSTVRTLAWTVDAPAAVRHPAAMSTLTIELSDELAARLAAASAEKQLPPAELVREALERRFPAPPPEFPEGKSLYDVMMEAGAIGCIDSGVTDLATNPKHMEGFGQWRR